MFNTTNPGLNGDWSPVTEEVILGELVIEGTIPGDLSGTLYRNCFNQRFAPLNVESFHIFDGDGMMYSVELRDGKAAYRNKWVANGGAKAELAAGRTLYNGLYSASGVPQPALPPGAPLVKHVGSVNVIRLSGRILALQESSDQWWEIEPRTLEVNASFNFCGETESRGALTAHPHIDPVTGNLVFMQLDSHRENNLIVAEADTSGKVISRHSIHLEWSAYIHDMMFTKDYYIVMLGPIGWDTDFVPLVRDGRSSWNFDPDRGSKILLINRATGAVQSFTDNPNQVNHYLNAYQDGDKVIIDASVCPIVGGSVSDIVAEVFPVSRSGKWQPFKPSQLWRWTIDTVAGTVSHEHVNELGVDHPRHNPTLMGSKHRYGYFMGTYVADGDGGSAGNAAVKHDYLTGITQQQRGSREGGFDVGEPLFVVRKGAIVEDDGYVLVMFRHGRTQTSQLLILDAQNFDGDPIARVMIPSWVPASVHGNWIPDVA